MRRRKLPILPLIHPEEFFGGGGGHQAPPPPPSHSGGTSGDLTVPHYTPRTPTVPYDPSEPSHIPGLGTKPIVKGGPRRRPASPPITTPNLISAISGLLSPGGHLHPRDIANAAQALGVPPLSELEEQAKHEVGKGLSLAVHLPQQRVSQSLGHKTLGTPTVRQVVKAVRKGTAQVNQHGKLTIPATRKAARQLAAARAAVAKKQGGNTVEDKIGSYLLRHGLNKVGAAGILGNAFAESSLNPGAQGYGGGGLWGFTSHPNSLSDLQSYAASQGRSWTDPKLQTEFLLRHVSPETIQHVNAASSPQQAAAIFMSEFERPGIPRQEVREGAAQKAFAGQWTQPVDPQAIRNLQVAIKNARANGINPTPANGDVEGGNGRFVTVRADAKGMVNWVESFVGTQEGTGRQLGWAGTFGLGSTQPWCANFVSNGLIRRGFQRGELPANPNYVPSYEEWAQQGRYATVVPSLAQAKPGDLVTFSGSHIGVIGKDGQMISGNYSNAVSESEIGAPSMIIRPRYKGGKVQVPVGQLPGSSAASATASPVGEAATGGTPGVGGPVGQGVANRQLAVGFGPQQVPISELLQTQGLEPRVSGLAETEEEGPRDTIARILARRRL